MKSRCEEYMKRWEKRCPWKWGTAAKETKEERPEGEEKEDEQEGASSPASNTEDSRSEQEGEKGRGRHPSSPRWSDEDSGDEESRRYRARWPTIQDIDGGPPG